MKLVKLVIVAVVAYVVWNVWKVKKEAPGFSWTHAFERWRAGF